MHHQAAEFCTKLNNRKIIELSGPDRGIFLQGLITKNVDHLQQELIIYSLLLSPQGKFQYDFFVINAGDTWLIDVDESRAESLMRRLQLFKLHANISLNINPDWQVDVSSTVTDAIHVVTDPRSKNLGYRLYGKDLLFAKGSIETYENLRLSLGVPDGITDMNIDKSIPLEWGMDELGAISWDKGCYMGQELTARSRYVSQIRKRAFPIEFTHQPIAITTGARLYMDTLEVGELRSHNLKFGIALLRLDAINHPNQITINNHPIKVHVPSWMRLPTA